VTVLNKQIPLAKPFFNDEELDEIKKVLDSGWVSQGPKVKEFEDKVAEFVGAKYAIAVTNCTCALHLSNLSLGIKKGDEAIVADYTFPATGHSVLYCRAKPVFCDVDIKTYNIDPEKIKNKITKKTKAIIPVHTFGQPAEMDKILEIAEKNDLFVIEDAACALGAKFKGKYAGTFGDIGCFSFHARKGITTGEGGMVVTNDKEIAEKIRYLSVFGMIKVPKPDQEKIFSIPEFTMLGYNYKMSDISAAIGVVQLKKLNKIIKRKRDLAHYYNERLIEIDEIEPPFVSDPGTHVYQSYVSLVNKRLNRNKCIELLLKQGIEAQIGTYSSHIQPLYGYCDPCPNSFDIFNRALALPMYFSLKEKNIDDICDNLEQIFEELA
jgi:dTDP-4-amino-4,6-dideoxygalactose transaminase